MAPKDQWGNRTDTEAGRAKSAQMEQNAANQAAIAAMAVAQSEASHGREAAAREAANKAAEYTKASSSVQSAVAAHTAQIFPSKDFTGIETMPYSPGLDPTPAGQIYSPSPPTSTPSDPWMRVNNYVQSGVKQASPDIVLFDQEAVSPEYLIQLEYEDISGSELINISRSDIINGQEVIYSPIKNLASWNQRYNPNNIIALPSIFNSYFSRYQIDLIFRGIREPYLNNNGDLVIEIDKVFDEELIEAEIDSNGTIGVVDLL